MDRFMSRLGARSTDRRHLVSAGVISAGIAGLGLATARAHQLASPVAASEIPVSGDPVPELSDFDTLVTGVMEKWSLPGGQLAIISGDQVLLDHGYGMADVEAGEQVAPEMTFRIASSSKPITGVAIQHLIDDGALTLDTPVFPLLSLEPPANATPDPRLESITVEQLLVHSGGWNSATGYDPQYLPWPLVASHVLAAENPASAETIIRFMLGQPLDFDPGTLSAYSNFGYNVLGRVIEHLTGKTYEQYVLDEIAAPLGITDWKIGGTYLEERLPGEVRYYGAPDQGLRIGVTSGEGYVPVGYGSFSLPSLDAHGGWISSAHDLARFALGIDGTWGPALLTP
ncbi:MAG TPA: serine hydrolase domain-containing protein, partial [Thermomicrobiales bacterium]|nr:serine hydrolase domain-containing protein [Thermomicrobiales bacterium]